MSQSRREFIKKTAITSAGIYMGAMLLEPKATAISLVPTIV